jgi:putative tryptophan/tyrosine transport system substrate-binding protein
MRLNAVRLVVVLALVLLTALLAAHAQPSTKMYRIGYLRGGRGDNAEDQAFKQRLRELGYTEGQNLVIEVRSGGGDAERYPALATELVQRKVDCLVVGGIPAIRAAQQATSTIPIVMINVGGDDPVRLGFITSLARPGGNITGVMDISAELAGKRLELLHEAFPHLARVGHLSDKRVTAHLHEVEAAARQVGVRIQPLEVQGPEDVEQAFQTARAGHAEALMVVHHGFVMSHRERIAQLIDTIRLPVIYSHSDFVTSGGLMSYGEDRLERGRRAAALVAKIFQGAQPADLPVERPTKFELVINLTAAKALGITLPPSILFQADQVIP